MESVHGDLLQLEQLLRDSRAGSIEKHEFSAYLDKQEFSIADLRDDFSYPTTASIGPHGNSPTDKNAVSETAPMPIYFCGNSLGLMPKRVRKLVDEELDIWAGRGVLGHFDHPLKRPWKDITDTVQASMARIVGAKTSEVAVMGTLTSNLHTLMSTFYRPRGKRTKILFEEKAFPSDQYAFTSQARLHDLDPAEHLLAMKPRNGEYTLHTQDILEMIEKHGDSIALVMFSGVQYYTGQFFDIPAITAKGHEYGATVGWDLAHAVGNLPLSLHDWNVDFACWCNYKYMNAGPGTIAGIFVHDDAIPPQSRHDTQPTNRLAGWWGHNAQTRFKMDPVFDPIPGAAGYQLSNPSVLNVVSLLASLETFQKTSMTALRQKSMLMTRYLELLLTSAKLTGEASFRIITPTDPTARGAQLSVLFEPLSRGVMEFVMTRLLAQGIIADERQPDVIRLSPVPSYNTFDEVRLVAQAVIRAVCEWTPETSKGTEALKQTT